MSSYEYEPCDESTPLISNNDSNRSKQTSNAQPVPGFKSIENTFADPKNQNSSSDNYSYTSIDKKNNNSNYGEEVTSGADSQAQDIRIYAKRWYILAIFSALGVLQVCLLLENLTRENVHELYYV